MHCVFHANCPLRCSLQWQIIYMRSASQYSGTCSAAEDLASQTLTKTQVPLLTVPAEQHTAASSLEITQHRSKRPLFGFANSSLYFRPLAKSCCLRYLQSERSERERERESMANLEDVPSLELMTELLRRMKCSSKPDKRLILIGTFSLRNRSDPSLYLVYREIWGGLVGFISLASLFFFHLIFQWNIQSRNEV